MPLTALGCRAYRENRMPYSYRMVIIQEHKCMRVPNSGTTDTIGVLEEPILL